MEHPVSKPLGWSACSCRVSSSSLSTFWVSTKHTNYEKQRTKGFRILHLSEESEKETQKGKMKNTKLQKSKRCENVKSNNRVIQKMRKWIGVSLRLLGSTSIEEIVRERVNPLRRFFFLFIYVIPRRI